MSVAGWSSLVARRAHNPKVVGSNPAPATKFKALSVFADRAFLLPIFVVTGSLSQPHSWLKKLFNLFIMLFI